MNIISRMPPIKALSVAGGFPLLLAKGTKEIEIRSWGTQWSGITLLHSSSSSGYEASFPTFGLRREDCPKFSIVGAARLKTCIKYDRQKWWDAHKSRHLWNEDFAEVLEQYGKPFYGHVFEDAILFDKPILGVRGAYGYWEPKKERQEVGFEKAIALLSAIGYC